MRLDTEDVVAGGEKFLIRLTICGMHRGELFGIAPAGRALEVAVLNPSHIWGGKLAEHRALLDDLGMLRQLGVTSSDARTRADPDGHARPERVDWARGGRRRPG